MSGRLHPCYLCGKPCWYKTCRECYTKGRHSSLAKKYNRLRKEQGNMKGFPK
jgi:hypothetical protein